MSPHFGDTSPLPPPPPIILLQVVRLRAAFAHGPAVVLAFEFVAGDLGGVLRAAPAPLPPARIRALLAMTLRGLGHCHRLHILHRVSEPKMGGGGGFRGVKGP